MGYETYRVADLIDECDGHRINIKVSCFVDSGVTCPKW